MKKIMRLLCIGMTVLMLTMSMSFATFADDEETTTDENTSEGTEQTAAKPDIAKGMVAHWEFEGNLNDSTAFKNNGVAIGTKGTGITYADGVFGKAVKFDGKSYIEVKDSDSLDLYNGFTISLWAFKEDMRKSNSSYGVPYIEKLGDDANDNIPYTLREWWYSTPQIAMGNDDETKEFNGSIIDMQKWYLITFTFDGSEVKIYNNGELVKSEICDLNALHSTSGKIRIGNSVIALDNCYYKGLMDDIRIYNYALDYDSVQDLYSDGLKGSGKNLIQPANKLVAYYKFDGNTKDASGFNNNGAIKGKISYVDGIAGKAAQFNGSSYVEVADSNSLDIDKAFTIEAWVYGEKLGSGGRPILNKYGTAAHQDKSDYAYSISGNSYGYDFDGITLGDNTPNLEISTSSDNGSGISDNAWYHIAYTYDGGKISSYLNGKLINSSDIEQIVAHSTGNMRIGGELKEFFKGAIDELKIYNYALDAKKVEQEYKLKDTVTLDAASIASLGKLTVGGTAKIKIIRKDAYNPKAAPVDCSATAKYSSSNPKVFTVSGGVVKAVGKGTANLTIVSGALSTNVKVTVK